MGKREHRLGERQICEKREKESNKELRGVRKSRIYIYIYIYLFGIYVRTVPNLERYCSLVQNVLVFKTPAVRCFSVIGVPNANWHA